MTLVQWKRLTSGAVIRRIGEDQEHQVGVDSPGNVYISWNFGARFQHFRSAHLTDPENWELVLTASQYLRREHQWRQEQEREHRDGDAAATDEGDA